MITAGFRSGGWEVALKKGEAVSERAHCYGD